MAPHFYRVIKSKAVKFLVGPDHEEIVIHGDVLRDYSIAPNDNPPPSETTFSWQESAEQQALILKGTVFEGPEAVKKFADYLIRRIEPRPSESSQGSHHPALDYTEELLTHARLHVFASKCKMEELRDVCLFKLLHLLHVFPLHDRRVGDIVELFRFTFVTETGMCGNIKTLLCHYVARHPRLFLRKASAEVLVNTPVPAVLPPPSCELSPLQEIYNIARN